MDNLSKIRLPDNTEVKIKDARLTDENNLVPLETKTYEGTDFIGTTDNWNNSTRYFMSVVPSSSTAYWHIKYRIKIWIPADTTNYRSETAIIEYFGYGITMNSYRIWNTLNSTYAAYYHTAMWLTADGLTNGYGHAIGESILYATNYATSSWYRHFIIDIIAYEGCTITLLDTPLKWSEWTGGNTTNYARGNTSPSTYNATTAGLQETGDNDSSSVQAYDAKAYKVGSTNIPAYNPIGENEDGCLVPMLSVPFLVEGPFYIYTSALTANATGSWVGLYYSHYNIQIRNGSSYVEGIAYKPLYLKGTISGVYFTTDSTTPYVTALPVSQDNFYYYYIGDVTVSTASSKYTYVSFKVGTHPVYYHDGTGIRLWVNVTQYTIDSTPTSGSTNLVTSGGVYSALSNKQDTLVSGTNIKTVNGSSVLGSGDLTISGVDTYVDVQNKTLVCANVASGGGTGEENVIEIVKVNGTALTPDSDKAVNVTVPTKTSDLTNDSGYTTNTGTLTGVTFNGNTATVTNGIAAITTTIPAAPGTLNTNNTTAQTVNSSEALTGTVKLHKVAKTGTYSDLIGTPTIPSAPGTLNTNNTTAQTVSSSEALSGSINLHKVAKTGTYSDLIGAPSITISSSEPTSSQGSNGDIWIVI